MLQILHLLGNLQTRFYEDIQYHLFALNIYNFI
jgi:hypothetical protein